MPPLSSGTRNLVRIYLASAAWAFSFGLGTQVATHWLRHAGASDTVIGLNHTCYYLGVALTSLCVPAATRRYGPSCAVGGLILSGISLVAYPWGGGLVGWRGGCWRWGGAGGLFPGQERPARPR